MLDKKECYGILGLKEGVGKAEVVKRYTILQKRSRMENSEGMDSELDMEKITAAYNLLMGYDTGEDTDSIPLKPNPLLKKIGVDEKKARNFLYYYKFHIIGAIILLIGAIFFIKDVVGRVPSDLDAAIIGNIYYNDTDTLKKNIMEKMPELKEMSIDAIMLSEGVDKQMEYASNMKAMVLFGAGAVDVFLLDKANFDKYASQGAFESLDALAESLNIDREKSKDLILETEDVKEEHLYGIDITESRILKESEVIGERIIVAVRVNAKHYENAIQMLKLLIE